MKTLALLSLLISTSVFANSAEDMLKNPPPEIKEKVEFNKTILLRGGKYIYLCERPNDLSVITMLLFGDQYYDMRAVGDTRSSGGSGQSGNSTGADARICVTITTGINKYSDPSAPSLTQRLFGKAKSKTTEVDGRR